MTHTGPMEASVIASYAAAGFSFVSVLLTGRMSRHSQQDQWRRDVERPLVAEFLASADQCRRQMLTAEMAFRDVLRDSNDHASIAAANNKMSLEYAAAAEDLARLSAKLPDLDLVAGEEVRKAAKALCDAYDSVLDAQVRMNTTVLASDVYARREDELKKHRAELVRLTRIEIGVEPRRLLKKSRTRTDR